MSQNDSLLDWMFHSIGLSEAALKNSDWYVDHGLMTRAQQKFLRWELACSTWCMRRLVHDVNWLPEAPHLRVWRDYMVGHARLQVRRYANEISEGEFHMACGVLRERRNSAFREGRKVA